MEGPQILEIEQFHPRTVIPNWIMIDGTSGSGKDTTARLLSMLISSVGINTSFTPEDRLDQSRDLLSELVGNDTGFLDQVVRNREAITPALNSLTGGNRLVITTRGETATAAYQTRGNLSIEDVLTRHAEHNIPLPGKIILLVSNPDIAFYRIGNDQTRGSTQSGLDGKFTTDPEKARKIRAQYNPVYDHYRRIIDTTMIDTGNLSVSDLIGMLVPQIGLNAGEQAGVLHQLERLTQLETRLDHDKLETVTASAHEILVHCRPNFDLPHTIAVTDYMKLLLLEYPNLDPTSMIAAAILHDIGYAGLFGEKANYGAVKDNKELHMALGAREALKIARTSGFTEEESRFIASLVLAHDDVEEVCDNASQALMEADTLGAFYMALVDPTFSDNELRRWLSKNRERRVPRLQSETAQKLIDPLTTSIEILLNTEP